MIVCISFALSLHASVPSVHKSAAQAPFAIPATSSHSHAVQALPNSDVSYYEEFYPAETRPETQAKSGILHRFASVIKKSSKKIAFF
jgi:hypothetical protein